MFVVVVCDLKEIAFDYCAAGLKFLGDFSFIVGISNEMIQNSECASKQKSMNVHEKRMQRYQTNKEKITYA